MKSAERPTTAAFGFHDRIQIGVTAFGRGVFASCDYQPGDVVVNFEAKFVSEATRYTIQIDAKCHLNTEGNPGSLLNHSCAPNCAFDPQNLVLIAKKKIKTGEELTFDYLTTEWEMSSPFECMCQSPECVGTVRGMKFATLKALEFPTNPLECESSSQPD